MHQGQEVSLSKVRQARSTLALYPASTYHNCPSRRHSLRQHRENPALIREFDHPQVQKRFSRGVDPRDQHLQNLGSVGGDGERIVCGGPVLEGRAVHEGLVRKRRCGDNGRARGLADLDDLDARYHSGNWIGRIFIALIRDLAREASNSRIIRRYVIVTPQRKVEGEGERGRKTRAEFFACVGSGQARQHQRGGQKHQRLAEPRQQHDHRWRIRVSFEGLWTFTCGHG